MNIGRPLYFICIEMDTYLPPAMHSIRLGNWTEMIYYWKGLHVVPTAYEAAKAKVAQQVIHALDQRYPGLESRVEAVDVATPVTYERYTANWRGSIYGWAMTMRKMALMMGKGMAKTLPGLRDFYLIGQWVEPGGNLQLSASSGRDVIEMICQTDQQPFISSAP